MTFEISERAESLRTGQAFMDAHVLPAERFEEQLDAQASRWDCPPIMDELKAKAWAEGCGTSSCRRASWAPGSPTSNMRRCARSWVAPIGPRASTAPPPTPATWRCWSATAPMSTRSGG